MVFNNIFFILVFLPVSVAVYYLVPRKAKLPVLAAAGICFYSWGGLEQLFWIGISVVFNWLAGMEISWFKGAGRKRAAVISVYSVCAANLLMLGIFKYASDSMPLGMSFYTFTVLSYIFDVYRDKTGPQYNFLKFLVYVTFFPKVISGPIVRYEDMEKQLDKISLSFENLRIGVQMFLAGLMKKVLIADKLGLAFAGITAGDSMSVASAWVGLLFFSLQLYFDFSGYSDMAIGIAKIFGFEIAPNFNYPYMSASVSDFWRRWHISLGNWFKHYLYFPMGGNRVPVWRIIVNTMTVWFATGLWHGSTVTFLIWGLYNGGFILLDKFVVGKWFEKMSPILRVAATLFVVCIGWVFFFSPTMADAGLYIGRLFGIGASGIGDITALSWFSQYIVIIGIAVFGCTKLAKDIYENIFYRNGFGINEKVLTGINIGITIALFILTIAEIIGGTYSTFMYAQF